MATDYVVADVAAVAEGKQIVVNVNGREIGVFNVRGQYYALPNVCLHQNGPLCRGAVSGTLLASAKTGWKREWVQEGEIVVCPWHALEFNITTGHCLAFPNRRLRTFGVSVKGDKLIVTL